MFIFDHYNVRHVYGNNSTISGIEKISSCVVLLKDTSAELKNSTLPQVHLPARKRSLHKTFP